MPKAFLFAFLLLVSTTTSLLVHPSPSSILQSDLTLNPSHSLYIPSSCLLHHSKTGHPLIDSGYYLKKIQARNNNMKECPYVDLDGQEHVQLMVR
jgi:hypothetical protein